MSAPLLEAVDLCRVHTLPDGSLRHALVDVSLTLEPGESVGVAGVSGSGKSTLARILLGLETPDRGHVRLAGVELVRAHGRARRALRRQAQPVFQDPGASLDPRQPVGAALAEPLRAHHLAHDTEVAARVRDLLGAVGLTTELAHRLPHALSGGQRQRVAVARALAVEPALLVADEPLANLDAVARAELVHLLARLRAERGLALILVSHDLAVIRQACDRLVVLDEGHLVEAGTTAQLLAAPVHPATRALVSAHAAASRPRP
jgi:ABC-type glutathione transport system ATPase component